MADLEAIVVLRGSLQRDIWRRQDDEDNFAICKFRPVNEEGRLLDEITIKGDIPSADREEVLELTGEWITDHKYGRQLSVFCAFRVPPSTLDGLRLYLAQVVDGIGPVLASNLVTQFGGELEQILNDNIDRLLEVKGITPIRLERIKLSWQREHKQRPIFVWLAEHGVTEKLGKKVVSHFGDQTISVLKLNPYRLAEVDGIGFKTADKMAQLLGRPKKSEHRTEAGVSYLLTEATGNGNSFLHMQQILDGLHHLAKVTEAEAVTAINNVVARGQVIRDDFHGELGVQTTFYLPYLHHSECCLADRLTELVRPRIPNLLLEDAIKAVQHSLKMEFTEQQLDAIRTVFSHQVSVLTGPPGTGKTMTVNGIVHVAEYLQLTYALAAPTGRAAKRMAELTDREAQTIHRLLQWSPERKGFLYNRDNPLLQELFIVDESSMLDLLIAEQFLSGVGDDAIVVLVGDVDQLPSVGVGTVLKDLIKSQVIPVSRLTKIFRQAEQSLIIRNAHRIREGQPPVFPPKGSRADSYFLDVPKKRNEEDTKDVDNADWVKATLVKLCLHHLPEKFKVDPVRDVQILVPMKKGSCGAPELNKVLQDALNPDGERFSTGRGTFRLGDRVQQHRNNYELNVYNGDVGFITAYSAESKSMTVDFYGHEVQYPFSAVDQLQLAYAMTIHRSQGSEYDCVIIVMLSEHYPMLERNLLYTANTRAKKLCLYVANKWAVERAAENAKARLRNSFLAERLSQGVHERCPTSTNTKSAS